MVGPGAAIEPFQGGLTVIAPCAGVVRKAKAHGFVIVDQGDAAHGVSLVARTRFARKRLHNPRTQRESTATASTWCECGNRSYAVT